MLKTLDFKGNYESISQQFANRKQEISNQVNDSVMAIIDDVKADGDKALMKYSQQFDGFEIDDPKDFIVTKEEIDAAIKEVGDDFIRILERTKEQITTFHTNQIEKSWSLYKEDGVIMGQIVRPLERVALYVPGGTAAYPSTVMMDAIPARIAGVKDIIMLTPVKSDGRVDASILAAAQVCGIETIYKVGGAQAIAAAAIGTDTIKKVDKIVGPGNIYVATAKKCCFGMVDIDMIAGPSEILVIADKTANPKYIAADLMSQAEHDVMASAILVTTAPELLTKVNEEIDRQIENLPRKDIIRQSLDNYGGAIMVDTIEEAFDVSNYLAPEHLEVLIDNPMEALPLIKNAGSIFLGEYTPEPLGDYMSGTNHVLPTGGTAKFYSSLGVYDYVKHSSYSYYPKEALTSFKDDIQKFARKEGLEAHANSIGVRYEDD